MATRINTAQVLDETIGRADLNSTVTGKAVTKKIVQGTNVTLSSTGVDSGTGDVTISVPSFPWSGISGKPTTLNGYGITDVYTKTQIDQMGVTPPTIKSVKLSSGPKWYKLFKINNVQNDFTAAGEGTNAIFRVLGQSDFGRTADLQTSFIEGSFGVRGAVFKPILTSKGDLPLGSGASQYQFQVYVEDGYAYLYMRTPTYSQCVIEYYVTGDGSAYITPVADVTFNNTTNQFDIPVPSTGTKYWDSADPTAQYQGMYIGNNPVAIQNTPVVFSRMNIASNNYFLSVRNPSAPASYLDALWDSSSAITVDTSASLEVSATAVNFSADVGIYGKLSISDTTLVTNLNADKLDGQDGSYYLNWTNLTNKPTSFYVSGLTNLDTTLNITDMGNNSYYGSLYASGGQLYLQSSADLNMNSQGIASVIATGTIILSSGEYIYINSGTSSGPPFVTSNVGLVDNLNSDKLDSQDGSYYLDWNNFTNKPTILTTGGTQGQLQYKDSTGLSGVAGTYVEPTGKMLSFVQQNTAPTDIGTYGYTTPYGRKKANFGSLGIYTHGHKFNKSAEYSIDEDLLLWTAAINSTTPVSIGFGAWSSAGSVAARALATTSPVHRAKRMSFLSTATAGTFAGYRQGTANFFTGSGTQGQGGFFFIGRFAQSNTAAVSGERFFFGVANSTAAPTNVDPATLTNSIGLAILSTDSTQYYLIASGASAQTAIPLGTAFGSPSKILGATSDVIELAIYSPSTQTTAAWVEARNITQGTVYETFLSTFRVPQASVGLAPNSWKTNNTTALVVTYDIMYIKCYINA